MRNLIASPSPRDLEEVWKERNKIPCDNYVVKYHYEYRAYELIRDFFLAHKEYDGYLIIAPDDLVFKDWHYDSLLADVNLGHPPVISGLTNLSARTPDVYAASVMENPEYCFMEWLTESNLPLGMIKVSYAGFSPTFIRRDVVEKVSFTGRPGGIFDKGCAFDLQFAIELNNWGIPQFVDTTVRCKHLTKFLGDTSGIKVGEKESYTRLLTTPEDIESQHLVL